jgi:DNA polymerase III sliding clamp (beta) subunit (PCNA family)
MKISITRGELKLMTAGLSKIIPSRANIAVLGCVRFAVQDGSLTASGTDLDQSARFWFDNAKVEGAGEIIIPFTMMRDMSKGDNSDMITLENEGLDVTVTDNVGGHVVTRTVDGIDPADWPPQGDPIPVGEAKGFLQAYRRLAPFASTDDTRRLISSIHVDMSGDGENCATLVATDGKRLTCCNSMKLPNVDKDGIILPVSKFLLWTGLSSDARIGVLKSKTSTQFGLTAGQWSYRTKGIDGEYPHWRQVVPKLDEDACHRIAFTDVEVDALRKIVPPFPGGDEIALVGEAGGRLSLCGHDKGSAREVTVPLVAGSTYKGPGCRFFANRHYLLDALNAGFRNFMFANTVSPMVSNDGKGAMNVLMPLRMNHEKPKTEAQPDPASQAVNPESPAQSTSTTTTTTEPAKALKPEPEPKKENTEMKQEKQTAPQAPVTTPEPATPTALERAQASFEKAKACLRDVQASLADMASDLREAVRDDRQRKSDTDGIRAMLQKLQTMKV